MKRTMVKLDKPIYLGMSILDVSKTLMYDFHYKYIKPKYEDGANLLFTDMDSLMYELKTEDFYQDIAGDVKDWFDTSNYPGKHVSGIPTGMNKKIPGMFKDEVGGKNAVEFVGLRAKLYAFLMDDGEEKKKCKGVKENVVARKITFNNYKNCLLSGKQQYNSQNVFRSRYHEIYTERVTKISLSADDDKRIILEDGIHTLAHGHHKTR